MKDPIKYTHLRLNTIVLICLALAPYVANQNGGLSRQLHLWS